MNGWKKLGQNEMEKMHELASEIIIECRTPENPDMKLASFEECTQGNTCIVCPLMELSICRLDQIIDKVRKAIPSATCTLEAQPGGAKAIFLDLYKYRKMEPEQGICPLIT